MPEKQEMILVVRYDGDACTVKQYGDNLNKHLKLRMLDQIREEINQSKEDLVG